MCLLRSPSRQQPANVGHPYRVHGPKANPQQPPPILMPEAQAGTLQYASSVKVGATTRASAQADRRGNDRASGETTRAGDGERIPIAGKHSTGPRGLLTIRRYRKTCCDSSVGYGSSSRAARRAAEGPKQGVLVFTSSSRQEAKPREALDKATYAQREKAASLLARTTARGTSNQRSCKVLPRPITATVYSTIR
ncbi:hypothetical protein MTO96_036023 [Rhipicephalus appendiculatus]